MTQAEEIVWRQGFDHAVGGGSKYDCTYSDAGLREAWEDGWEEGNFQALDRMRWF